MFSGIALKEEQEREAAAKRNTLPERKTDGAGGGDSPRQSRSPLKNDKKEKVSGGNGRR